MASVAIFPTPFSQICMLGVRRMLYMMVQFEQYAVPSGCSLNWMVYHHASAFWTGAGSSWDNESSVVSASPYYWHSGRPCLRFLHHGLQCRWVKQPVQRIDLLYFSWLTNITYKHGIVRTNLLGNLRLFCLAQLTTSKTPSFRATYGFRSNITSNDPVRLDTRWSRRFINLVHQHLRRPIYLQKFRHLQRFVWINHG